jgi:hypothetical protein
VGKYGCIKIYGGGNRRVRCFRVKLEERNKKIGNRDEGIKMEEWRKRGERTEEHQMLLHRNYDLLSVINLSYLVEPTATYVSQQVD